MADNTEDIAQNLKKKMFSFRLLVLAVIFPFLSALALALWHLGGAPGFSSFSLLVAISTAILIPRGGFFVSALLIGVSSLAFPWSKDPLWSLSLPIVFMTSAFLGVDVIEKHLGSLREIHEEKQRSFSAVQQMQQRLLEAQRFSAQCLKEKEECERISEKRMQEAAEKNRIFVQDLQGARMLQHDLEQKLLVAQNNLEHQGKEKYQDEMQALSSALAAARNELAEARQRHHQESVHKPLEMFKKVEEIEKLFQQIALSSDEEAEESNVYLQLRVQFEEKSQVLRETRRQLFEMETLCLSKEKAEEERERTPQLEDDRVIEQYQRLEIRIEELESEVEILEGLLSQAFKPSKPRKTSAKAKKLLEKSLELQFENNRPLA